MNELTQQEVDALAFKTAFRENIKRKGAEGLLRWLETAGFFTAPAGAKHHGAYPGGLVVHSLNVYRELRADFIRQKTDPIYPGEYWPTEGEEETLAVCGLLHDVCKAGVYHEKDGGGYEFRDDFPMGHGEKSVFLITCYMHLYGEEALAIRWHMGAYDDAVRGGSRALNDAMDYSPMVYALHAADMRASQRERELEARNEKLIDRLRRWLIKKLGGYDEQTRIPPIARPPFIAEQRRNIRALQVETEIPFYAGAMSASVTEDMAKRELAQRMAVELMESNCIRLQTTTGENVGRVRVRAVLYVMDPPEGERVRAIRYKADFSYLRAYRGEDGVTHWTYVVEDVKSRPTRTRLYLTKKKLMREKLGICITEI